MLGFEGCEESSIAIRHRDTESRDHANRGAPRTIQVDNGTEFTSNHFDAWAYLRGIDVDFIRPGKPVDNAHIESFNGRLRDECLNSKWFESLDDARKALQDRRQGLQRSETALFIGGHAPFGVCGADPGTTARSVFTSLRRRALDWTSQGVRLTKRR